MSQILRICDMGDYTSPSLYLSLSYVCVWSTPYP
jgi:hypothetical protein